MGWSSGTSVFCDVLESLQEHVPSKEQRRKVIVELIATFENADWDNLDEAFGIDPVYDEIFVEMYGYNPLADEEDIEYDEDDEILF
jgi:hypothetical protein